jgi:hypothetical protein
LIDTMPRNTKPRKPYRPRPVSLDPVEDTIARVGLLPGSQRSMLNDPLQRTYAIGHAAGVAAERERWRQEILGLPDLGSLPEPFDYCYEWDGPYGTRKFSSAQHNGMKPHRSVPLYTADQMRTYAADCVRAALADRALDRMADNARALGLDYAPTPDRAAMQMALDALEDARHHMSAAGAFTEPQIAACDALRAALAHPAPAEPVRTTGFLQVVDPPADPNALKWEDAAPAEPAERPCTCHPDDNPPQPCAKRYALAECKAAHAAVANVRAKRAP